jgi:hypothetical protein
VLGGTGFGGSNFGFAGATAPMIVQGLTEMLFVAHGEPSLQKCLENDSPWIFNIQNNLPERRFELAGLPGSR